MTDADTRARIKALFSELQVSLYKKRDHHLEKSKARNGQTMGTLSEGCVYGLEMASQETYSAVQQVMILLGDSSEEEDGHE